MQNLTERKLWFWINNIEGIGNIKIRKLLEIFQTPRAVWEADRDKLMSISVINEKDADNIYDRDKRKHILERYYILEDKGIGFVFPWEKEYPGRLKELYDKPYILYYKGELPSDKLLSVGVVGARKCSEYGRYVAGELGRTLGMAGVNVISGLAYGIDSEAHRGTLMGGGRTYGVLAGGVDKCYPAGNFNLYMDILEQGGIISEFPPGTATVPGMFP
ncbi:MAG: DNA-processing protein DprA, partial [Butyrivibrio sp.]